MRIGIAGIASVSPPTETAWNLEDLVFRASSGALDDAGITRRDIDGVCISASDQLDGRMISSMHLAGPAGGYLRDEIKIADDGLGALAGAVLRLEAGVSQSVLVAAWTKTSEADLGLAEAVNADPIYERPVGLHPAVGEAMAVQRSLHDHGLGVEHLDAIANGTGPDDREYLAWPLRRCHVVPPTDGAVALVLTAEPAGTRLLGFDWTTDHPNPLARPHDALGAMRNLADRLEHRTGVDPTTADVIESTDRNTFRLLTAAAWTERRTPADVVSALADGTLERLNPSGGLRVSNPPWAAGLERVVEAVRAVRGGADRAVAHGSYGQAGQAHALAVVEGS